MKNKIFQFSLLNLSLMLLCVSLLSGCADEIMEARAPLSAVDITQFKASFSALTDANREAHNAEDLDAIQALFTENMLFEDRTFRDHLVGTKAFMSMTKKMFQFFPGFQWKTTGYFIDGKKLLTTTEFWEMSWTGKPEDKYTEEDPFIHVFLFEREGHLISSWRLFYGWEFLQENHEISETDAEQMKSLVNAYAAAWSSKDLKALTEIYAKDAVRKDSLFDESQDNQSDIQAFAEAFFTWYPDARWTPLEIFGERLYRDKPQAVGSSFKIEIIDATDEVCEVEAVVLLHVFEGKIIQEDIYYETDSLIQCGWAERELPQHK
jgi:ketosteroid isomerase-like protein